MKIFQQKQFVRTEFQGPTLIQQFKLNDTKMTCNKKNMNDYVYKPWQSTKQKIQL